MEEFNPSEKNGNEKESNSTGEIRVIVRGDDFGACHSVNKAIEKSFKEGILTSSEIIVPAPWFEEGVEISRNNPDLDIGIHLTLNSEWKFYDWGPVSSPSEVPSLVNEKGYFYPTVDSFLEADPEIDEIRKELEAQIEVAIERNIDISHLSFHMATAVANSEQKEVVKSLAEKYGYFLSEFSGEKFWEDEEIPIYTVPPDKKKGALKDILEGMGSGTWLITVHPGFDTFEMKGLKEENPGGLKDVGSHRSAVTDALTDEEVKGIVRRRGIELVDYRNFTGSPVD